MKYNIPYAQAREENPEAVAELRGLVAETEAALWTWTYLSDFDYTTGRTLQSTLTPRGETSEAEEAEMLRQVDAELESLRFWLVVVGRTRVALPREQFRSVITEQIRLLRASRVYDAMLLQRDRGPVAVLQARNQSPKDATWRELRSFSKSRGM